MSFWLDEPVKAVFQRRDEETGEEFGELRMIRSLPEYWYDPVMPEHVIIKLKYKTLNAHLPMIEYKRTHDAVFASSESGMDEVIAAYRYIRTIEP